MTYEYFMYRRIEVAECMAKMCMFLKQQYGNIKGGTLTKFGVVGNREGWSPFFFYNEMLKHVVGKGHTIISGGAKGIDMYAESFAKVRGLTLVIYYPNPDVPSPQRYFERNEDIAKECDVLIAFDKGSSAGSGTLNTINHARRLGKKVIVISKETP